jgi:16S rRNA (uracil1498-N3)-methyltransferase
MDRPNSDRLIRLHHAPIPPPGQRLSLEGTRAHYLRDVMRLKPGEAIRLFNAKDGEWRARAAEVDRRTLVLVIEDRLRLPAAEPDFWLLFALLKRSATELVVQKATELGAARLLSLLTTRAVAHSINRERLAAIATEAAEQCERLSVPEIAAPAPLSAILSAWPASRPLIAAIEREERAHTPAELLPRLAGQPAALLIGPEGGFTAEERALLVSHPAVLPLSFGPRILRAETAAIAGLALFLLGRAEPALAAGGAASHLPA